MIAHFPLVVFQQLNVSKMILTKKNKEKIKKHAREESPRECCGVLVSTNKGTEAHPCVNTSSLPESNFRVSPRDYIKFSNYGKIEAIYHSHPSGKGGFSLGDQQNYTVNKERFILYNIESDEFFDSLEEGASPYLGRDFELGKTDCINIVIDYYLNELKIKSNYDECWPGPKHYIKKNGSSNVKKVVRSIEKVWSVGRIKKSETPRKHDVILYKADGIRSEVGLHLGVCIGHGKIIIQPVDKKSCLVDYESLVKKKTIMIFRPNFINE